MVKKPQRGGVEGRGSGSVPIQKIRFDEEGDALIRRAAEQAKRSINSYVVNAAVAQARRDLGVDLVPANAAPPADDLTPATRERLARAVLKLLGE